MKEDIKERIQYLQHRLERLEDNEELCTHHWNGSDKCYECYCTGCGRHIAEIRSEHSIPFKEDAYCWECKESSEEKEAKRVAEEKAKKDREIKLLRELKKRYPDE